jgi:hypothetical protein
MDTIPHEFLRVVLALFVLGVFVWTAWILRRHYMTGVDPLPNRLSRMMRRLGIGTRNLEALEYQIHLSTAARLCDACTSKAKCDAWLMGHPGADTPPAFCQNAQFLNLVGNHRAKPAVSQRA